MAVAFVMEFEGATLDQYDQVIGKMGLAPGGPGGAGGVSHWVTETEGGIRVTDVWVSDEAFQKFADEQIGPLTAEAGMGEPQITRFEVHNHLTPGPNA